MDHADDEPTSPGDDAALAQTLLAKGELVHGAFHLAGALYEEPLNADWLELLDRFVEAASTPLELAPLKDEPEGNWVGIVALRALILARIG
jgi:hypothetical protein